MPSCRARIAFIARTAIITLVVLGIASSANAWGRKETEAYYGELHLHTALSTDALAVTLRVSRLRTNFDDGAFSRSS